MLNNYFEYLLADLLTYYYSKYKKSLNQKEFKVSLKELEEYETVHDLLRHFLRGHDLFEPVQVKAYYILNLVGLFYSAIFHFDMIFHIVVKDSKFPSFMIPFIHNSHVLYFFIICFDNSS